MGAPTRRGFLALAGVGVAGAAGIGVAAGAGLTKTAAVKNDQVSGEKSTGTPIHGDSFVVYVQDVQRGQLSILVGEREILVTNPELASQLARAAGNGTPV